jgi:hypothetical protein
MARKAAVKGDNELMTKGVCDVKEMESDNAAPREQQNSASDCSISKRTNYWLSCDW